MRRSIIAFLLFTALFGSVSCKREPLVLSDLYNTFDLVIRPRWSEFDKRPTGMTAFIYPVSGGQPKVVTTNNVDSISVQLFAGGYRVLLMNQSPSEFPYFEFRNIDSYYDCEVVAAECENTQGYSLIPGCRMSEYPGILAVDCCNEISVTQTEIDEAGSTGMRVHKLITMKPHIVVSTLYITVPVYGIYNAWSATGCIDGMSRSAFLTYFDTGSGLAAHSIEPWTPHYVSLSSQYGSLTASITTLGLPDTPLYLSSSAQVETGKNRITKSETDPKFKGEDIILHLKVLLVDLKTVISKDFAVGDKIVRTINEPLVLDLNTAEYIELPYVQPADGSGKAGFDVEVDDWFLNEMEIDF